jgi:hypothetical protein
LLKLCFYVPESHLSAVKTAVFAAGAGRVGNYDQCCWQTLGQGQFRPLGDSDPYVGNLNELSTVAEYKVELVCGEDVMSSVTRALLAAHPYETPAFDIVQLENVWLEKTV